MQPLSPQLIHDVASMSHVAPGAWNSATVEYPQACLHDLIQIQAEQVPSRIAVRFENTELSYAELAGRSNQLACHLRSRGVSVGQTVAICVERSLDMMVGLLGILKSGAAYIPIDPIYPRERKRAILEDGKASALVSQYSLAGEISSFEGDTFCMDRDWHKAEVFPPCPFASGATAEDRAYVIFTSGSTGRPKGVQIPHRAVVNLLQCMRRELKVCGDDVLPALASFAFDMCIPELYLPLIAGGTVVIAGRDLAADGRRLWQLIRNQHGTIMQATPTTWALLLKAGFHNPGMRMICGAEPLPRDLCTQLLERTDLLYNFYGPTETTVWSTFDILKAPLRQIAIGRPLDNTQVYVLNSGLEPVPAGEASELLIAGDGLAIGYLGQPELTAERFIPNPYSPESGARMYRTLDLGQFLPDGRIEFAGRADHQVKIRGFRIELGEIEEVLRNHPGVSDVIVTVYEDDRTKRLIAYVVGEHVVADELSRALERRLPEYMIPSAFVILPELPRLPNGKVNRRGLPVADVAASLHLEALSGPRNPTEEFLTAAWRELLRVSHLGIFDDFFRLGADSLLVTQLASRILNAYEIEVPMKAIFEARTIAKLALEVDQLKLNPHSTATSKAVGAIARGLSSAKGLAERLDEMSEAEIDALLADISGERISE